MTNGGDAAEQVIRMSLDGVEYAVKIAGAGAKNLASILLALAKSKKSHPPNLKISGAERMKRMLKSGRPLDVFSVKEKDIRMFMQEAKKYGIVYCAIRDKEPKADGMVDVMVRKEDAPKINRVMECLQYATVDKTSIKSEIVKTKAEKATEPSVPDKSDNLDVDSFLDSVMPDEGKTKAGQNQAVQPPVQQKAVPEVAQEHFFSDARTKQNPSGHGLENNSNPEKKTTEPPSVKEEIQKIRAEQKKEVQARKDDPQRGNPGQQTTRHKQPQTTRKPKNKTTKER